MLLDSTCWVVHVTGCDPPSCGLLRCWAGGVGCWGALVWLVAPNTPSPSLSSALTASYVPSPPHPPPLPPPDRAGMETTRNCALALCNFSGAEAFRSRIIESGALARLVSAWMTGEDSMKDEIAVALCQLTSEVRPCVWCGGVCVVYVGCG